MSEPFNPYHAWLGLDASLTEPSYFQLMGLDEGEDDGRLITAAADRAASRVRSCRPGEHAAHWARLLDEITAAKKCLADPRLRAEYRRSKASLSPNHAAQTVPATSQAVTPNPNLYPPGMAPAMAPLELNPPAQNVDPQAPMMPAPAAMPMAAAMVSSTDSSPMSPAGYPYLQPAESVYPATMNPMAPSATAVAPMASPYMPVAGPMSPLSFGSPSTGMPATGFSAQAIPMAMPLTSMPQASMLAQAVPYGGVAAPLTDASAAFPAASPMASINPNSAAMVVARNTNAGVAGPIILGVTIGVVLLAGLGGYMVWNSRSSDSDEVAQNNPDDVPSAPPSTNDSTASPQVQDNPPPNPTTHSEPPQKSAPAEIKLPSLVDGPPKSDEMPKKPDKSAAPPKPELKPEMKTTPETKPKPDDKPVPTPTPTKPDEPDDIPKPTKEELVKLGRALQKARENIGEHEFDKADAFLSAASEMPRLPEHQAMIDRLKLLRESVQQYRTAIEASVGNLKAGESFLVGESNVGIVEVGPDRLVFRVAGQNKRFTMRDLPVGLAAALAAQSLAKDDPSTLMLKGAYVLASPLAKTEDLTKAREFLEQAAAESEPAKELLKLLTDKYDFANGGNKK